MAIMHNVKDKFKNKNNDFEVEIVYVAPSLDLEREQIYFCKITYGGNSVIYDAYCQGILDNMIKLLN